MTRRTGSHRGRLAGSTMFLAALVGGGLVPLLPVTAAPAPLTAQAAANNGDSDDADSNGKFTPGPTVKMAPDRPRGQAGAPAPASAASVGPDEDIRDIRGPKYVVATWLIPAAIGALLACALAAYGVWRWLRRRQQPRPLLPFELALQQLENLRPLMEPVHAREFSIAVSDIIRRWIEERFNATATHRTTEEFLHDLLESTHPSLIRYRPLLSEFLHQCDLVKFGGMSLSVAHMESLQQSGRAFVLETAKPDEPAPTPPAGPTKTAGSTAAEAHDSLPST